MGATPAWCIRGGTSKCLVLDRTMLPAAEAELSALLLRPLGSPDIRQIDGEGGGTSLTSKACLVAPSSRGDCHVDFMFAQVGVDQAVVDYGGNCGNCTSAVAVWAIWSGLVRAHEPVTAVRIWNTNTEKLVIVEVPVQDGNPVEEGELAISGVPGTGAPLRIWFVEPQGSVTGRLLPSGSVVDEVDGVPVSLVDAGAPVVFADAKSMGLTGVERQQDVDGDTTLLERLERLRGWGAQVCGLVNRAEDARRVSPSVPKVAWVAPPRTYTSLYGKTVDAASIAFCARILSMGRLHAAFAITGALAAGAASLTDGTVVANVAAVRPAGAGAEGDQVVSVPFGHPSGRLDMDVALNTGGVTRVGVYRAARRLWRGEVFIPDRLPVVADRAAAGPAEVA